MKRLVIFASGSGSNAENIINHFKKTQEAEVVLILSNNPKAYVLERAKNNNVSAFTFNKEAFTNSDYVISLVKNTNPDLIILAGFLWKIPERFVQAFPNKIINIHPALLPKYGGKGMYGMNVHEAVVKNKEQESGITIHYVNENYDEGAIITQASCKVENSDTAEDVAKKIHELEYEYFPQTIATLLNE